jgi:hypothetical protein
MANKDNSGSKPKLPVQQLAILGRFSLRHGITEHSPRSLILTPFALTISAVAISHANRYLPGTTQHNDMMLPNCSTPHNSVIQVPSSMPRVVR